MILWIDFMKNTDLHIHSNYSDGLFSPSEIISFCKDLNLKAISITDHDCIDGLNDARNYAANKNIEFIDGVEIQCAECEILGYFFNKEDNELNKFLELHQVQKQKYILKKIDVLNDMNIDISYEDVLVEQVPGRQLMATHIALAMIKKGYGSSLQEVFKKYLNKIKIKLDQPPTRAKKIIKVLSNAGGVSVLPHPSFLKGYQKEDIDFFVKHLVDFGITGVETTFPLPLELDVPEEHLFLEKIKQLAKQYELVECGGSDFHGKAILPINILGKYNVDYSVVSSLQKKCRINGF